MLIRLDGNEHRHAGVHLYRIEDCHPALNDTGLFQFLHAAPAGRRGKTYLFSDLSNRSRAILLQQGKDLDVHIIQHEEHREKNIVPLIRNV